jgi:hypothetical protein
MSAQPQHSVIAWKAIEKRLPGHTEPLPANDEVVIAGLGIPIEFKWIGKDVHEFIHMWNEGLALDDIAKSWPDRNPDDVIDLWRHCMYMNWIKDRPGGIYGRRRRG